MKEFNYIGVCIPELHYMVDTSSKMNKIKAFIDENNYFTISRPRQYGKTTTISLLEEELREEYTLISISFEGLGEIFDTEEIFCQEFIEQIEINILNDEEVENFVRTQKQNVTSLAKISKFISGIADKASKKIVLLIDEVDKASNHVLFLSFLGMLRSKYLMSRRKRDKTFHSVILAGVHDIKNIKMKITGQNSLQYNSPWNIAVDFDVNMSFSAVEIQTMLDEYEADKNTGMDKKLIAEKLYDYTSGYPYLVSKLCYIVDKKLNSKFTQTNIEEAVKIILNENNTLFDDLIKNIENNKELYDFIKKIIVQNETIDYVQTDPMISLGSMYGILNKTADRKVKVHNKIFELLLYNHMISAINREENKLSKYNFRDNFIDENGDIELEKILIKFKQFIKENYSDRDEKFYEKQGRLLLMAFIKPIINGTGFYYIENQVSYEKRLDMIIVYNEKEYILEFKLWYGKEYHEAGLKQLESYLDIKNHSKGYLVVFNFNKNKTYSSNWITQGSKEIFEVVV